MTRLDPGTVFAGEYVALRLLGQGGMGAVYEVEQKSTGARRALKVMQPALTRDPKAAARFDQEARIGATIPSDHVVEVLAAGIDQATGSAWLVMELLEGEDLATFVARRGLLPVSEVHGILEQLCHALAAAHAVGVVHRDLKPENVFVGGARQVRVSSIVKVLDFGIAKLVAESRAATTQAMGTPLWMAPEQAQTGDKIRPSTDVWALGLLAYWLLTERYYWRSANEESATPMALMREVLLDDLAPASARSGRALPIGFDGWFARAVCREPERRFADAGEAWRALEPVLANAGDRSGPTMPMRAPPAPPAAQMPDRASPGQHRGVRVTDSQAPAKTPHSAASAYQRALQSLRDGDWGAARTNLERAVQEDPELGAAHLRLALVIAFDPSFSADAQAPFRRAVQLRGSLTPRDLALLRGLEPLVSFDPPEREESARRLRAVAEAFPDDAELLLVAAIVTGNDDPSTRARLAERAVHIDSGYSDALALLGDAYDQLGREDDACRMLEQAIELSPHSVDAYIWLAILHASRGDARATETAARRALAIAPSTTAYACLLGAVHARHGRPEALRTIAASLVVSAPEQERSVLQARLDAALAVLQGDFDLAERHVSEMARLVAPAPMMVVHADATTFAVELALERGEIDRAGDLALAYLDRREVWRASRRPSADSTPLCLAVARRAGRIDRVFETKERDAWLERYGSGSRWTAFALAFAPALDDPDSVALARAALPSGAPPMTWPRPSGQTSSALIGFDAARLLLALGEPEQAADLARRAARTCIAPLDPFRSTKANLVLAEALVAARPAADQVEAQNALRVVVDRWGAAASVTARRAREMLAKLQSES